MGIWGYAGRQAGRFALGLAGAFLLAAAVAALSVPGARGGWSAYLGAFAAQLGHIFHLRFGLSAVTAMPVAAEIARALPVTFELVGAGLVVALVIGVPVGLLFATARIFRSAAPLIQMVTALPVFCAALVALWLAHCFGWTVRHPGDLQFWNALAHGKDIGANLPSLALPALIVGASGAAAIQLTLRRAAAGAMAEPFYANLKRMGLSQFEIDRACLPPYLLIGLFGSLGEIALSLLAADAVSEWMFAWPGAADLFIRSVALEDWRAAAPVLLVFAGVVLAADFVGRLGRRALAGQDE
jgi:peptide/nickel transport system permease protein